MFPGPGAQVYRNEAGEPIGWDYPSEPEYDPDDYLPGDDYDEEEAMAEDNPYAFLDHVEERDTWPDLDGRCEDLLKEAFSVLNEAPGLSATYGKVQVKIASAIRILRGLPE